MLFLCSLEFSTSSTVEAETSTTSRSAPRCTIWLEIGMWPSNMVPQPRPNDGLSNRQKLFSRPPYNIHTGCPYKEFQLFVYIFRIPFLLRFWALKYCLVTQNFLGHPVLVMLGGRPLWLWNAKHLFMRYHRDFTRKSSILMRSLKPKFHFVWMRTRLLRNDACWKVLFLSRSSSKWLFMRVNPLTVLQICIMMHTALKKCALQ